MSASKKTSIALSVSVIVLGIGWILDECNVLPDVNWIWTAGLALAGVLVLMLGGLNQFSVLAGPFLITGSILSLLRQTGHLRLDLEAPVLLIAFGVFLLVSHVAPLPPPDFLRESAGDDKK